jgi:hypothetical protein
VPLTAEVSVVAHLRELGISKEGWQVVKIKHPCPCTDPQTDSEARW